MSATITVIERAKVDALNSEYAKFEADFRSAGQRAWKIGQMLLAIKADLTHGEFGPWLDEHFEGSRSSAERFMRVAREYDDASRVTDLSLRAALEQVRTPRPTSGRPDRVAIDASLAAEFGDEPEPDASRARAREATAIIPADGAAEARKVRRARDLWTEIGDRLSELERDGMSRLARREEANAAGVTARRLIVALDDLTASYER